MQKSTFFLFSVLLRAMVKKQTIYGIVLDKDNISLRWAYIIVKGKTRGALADYDRDFTPNLVEEGTILVFSYAGFQIQELPIYNTYKWFWWQGMSYMRLLWPMFLTRDQEWGPRWSLPLWAWNSWIRLYPIIQQTC